MKRPEMETIWARVRQMQALEAAALSLSDEPGRRLPLKIALCMACIMLLSLLPMGGAALTL